MPEEPFLSVVMPIHDGAEWIGTTLDSMAEEPIAGLEIIIIDSSPSSETAAIVERYAERLPLRLLRRPDVKPWQTKTNLGVALASAEHVCILHQDDLWLPGRVANVRRWIAHAPDVVLHLAPSRLIDRNGRTIGKWTCPLPAERPLDSESLLTRLLVQNFVSVPAPIFRKDAWLECGGMDDQLWYTADWDIWIKLSTQGETIYHDEMTTAFRVHGSSLTVSGSRDAADFRSQMEVVLNRHLERIPLGRRPDIERLSRASINVNVSLAAVSGGSATSLASAAGNLLSLGPVGMSRYFRDSRIGERAVSRLRAKLTGAF